jgi:hypothetical protein
VIVPLSTHVGNHERKSAYVVVLGPRAFGGAVAAWLHLAQPVRSAVDVRSQRYARSDTCGEGARQAGHRGRVRPPRRTFPGVPAVRVPVASPRPPPISQSAVGCRLSGSRRRGPPSNLKRFSVLTASAANIEALSRWRSGSRHRLQVPFLTFPSARTGVFLLRRPLPHKYAQSERVARLLNGLRRGPPQNQARGSQL